MTPLIGIVPVNANSFCADQDYYVTKYEIQVVENRRVYLDEDTRLMLKLSKGDERAYNRLYEKYFPIVASYATSINGHDSLSEDIAQEVFSRIWQQRKKYRPGSTVKTYLFGYAKNTLRETKTTLRREKTLDIDRLSNLPSALHQSDVLAQNEYIVESLKKLITKLPDKQRRVFELVYISGLSFKKTAETLQCSTHSVYDNLYKGRKNLRKLAVSPPT